MSAVDLALYAAAVLMLAFGLFIIALAVVITLGAIDDHRKAKAPRVSKVSVVVDTRDTGAVVREIRRDQAARGVSREQSLR